MLLCMGAFLQLVRSDSPSPKALCGVLACPGRPPFFRHAVPMSPKIKELGKVGPPSPGTDSLSLIRHSWHGPVKKPWKTRNTARAHSAGAAAPTVAPGRADTTLTLEQENAVLREELRWAHEDLATFEEVAQVCHPSPRDARAPWCASCKAHPIGRNPDTESAADRRWREIGGRRWSAVSFFVLCCVASARASGQLRGTGTRRRVLLCREAGAGM